MPTDGRPPACAHMPPLSPQVLKMVVPTVLMLVQRLLQARHNYIGHCYTGHNYIGRVHIGHNHVGHSYVGHNYVVPTVLMPVERLLPRARMPRASSNLILFLVFLLRPGQLFVLLHVWASLQALVLFCLDSVFWERRHFFIFFYVK